MNINLVLDSQQFIHWVGNSEKTQFILKVHISHHQDMMFSNTHLNN